MLPGFWEFLLIAIVGGWIIFPFFYRRNERLKARRAQSRKSSKHTSPTSKRYTPPQDAIDVDYEEI